MRLLSAFFALLLVAPLSAAAQEDTTPPVLLDFTISPVVFDTGPAPVTLTVCVTGRDDLSGLFFSGVSTAGLTTGGALFSENIVFSGAPLEGTACDTVSIPQFKLYDTYSIFVSIRDTANNTRFMSYPDTCGFGPCEIVNRPASSLPDSDNDGIYDDSDNCPDDMNPGQEDADLDLLGDVCDPFPNDRDNEQAQCELDRDQALADLDMCLALPKFQDDDADGEENSTDICPETALTDRVDADGCSLAQYCALFDATTQEGSQGCRKADWLNDEPNAASPKDCLVDKSRDEGAACVPRM